MARLITPGSNKWPAEMKCSSCEAVWDVYIEDLFQIKEEGVICAAFLCRECWAVIYIKSAPFILEIRSLLTFEEWRQKYLLK